MSNEDYEKELRESQKALLQAIYPADYASLKQAAKELNIEFERARQARQYGKGSTFTINGLILFGLGIHPKDLKKRLPKIRELLTQPTNPSTFEELVEEARTYYGENDLIAWLRLLIARYKIETEIGIKKRSLGRPRKS